MSIKVELSNGEQARQARKFPCLRRDGYENILLFKDKRTCTIIYSKREENIGTQYHNNEYNSDNLEAFKEKITLSNIDYIEE